MNNPTCKINCGVCGLCIEPFRECVCPQRQQDGSWVETEKLADIKDDDLYDDKNRYEGLEPNDL